MESIKRFRSYQSRNQNREILDEWKERERERETTRNFELVEEEMRKKMWAAQVVFGIMRERFETTVTV